MPSKRKTSQLGDLAPMYNFILNPYPDMRISRCPFCEKKSGQRKLPLLIHVKPAYMISLNYTNRYCKHCDVLIAHKYEIEHMLAIVFQRNAPEVLGNEYLIVGTVEKKAWREGMKQPQNPNEIFPHTHDFKTYYQELRMTSPGWYADDQEPPILEPPPSQEWVKR